jgi:hypothetical protein
VPRLPPINIINITEKTFVTSVSTLKDSIRSFSQSPQHNSNITVRYRKIGHDTSIQEVKLSELRVAESQLKLQKKAEERLKQLEQIEAYREEHLPP